MQPDVAPGYTGRVLRVDLSHGRLNTEEVDQPTMRKWVGGTGLGARYLYEEVPRGVEWDSPENRLIMSSGPLGGTTLMGTGTISFVTKGPMTNGATSTQANGYMGAFMKFAGHDGVVIQGQSPRWVYLYLHDGQAELRPAEHLLGLDTWEAHDRIAEELNKNKRAISVFSVGPAGENRVRFAAIAGDHGHVAGHNGSGAVMGAKRLKAIVAERGGRAAVAHPERLKAVRHRIIDAILADPASLNTFDWGTSTLLAGCVRQGWAPVKNYTTNLFVGAEPFQGNNYRETFAIKPTPCWACRSKHLHEMTITSGPYAGFTGEEPEFEQWASWGPLIGNADVAGAFVLSNLVDRLGMDTNEAGWVVAWVMEAYEKGVLSRQDLNGLDLTWGNVEAVRALLQAIAHREGIGDLLAEGVKRAAETWGRDSQQFAIYTEKGSTPRSHDHRARWAEMMDTCFSSTGTIEVGTAPRPEELGARTPSDPFSGTEVAELNGRTNGRMTFEDCLGICRFTARTSLTDVAEGLNAVTGWDFTVEECMAVGRRANTLLRCFNLKHGIGPETEYPSARYSSIPVDGPARGKSIREHWESSRRRYYDLMGWDLKTGKPLPETLTKLGLELALRDLWPRQASDLG